MKGIQFFIVSKLVTLIFTLSYFYTFENFLLGETIHNISPPKYPLKHSQKKEGNLPYKGPFNLTWDFLGDSEDTGEPSSSRGA